MSPPATGSLLDLKTDANDKGLLLPRVKILSATIPAGKSLAQTIDGNEASDDWDAKSHVGLLVYSVGRCNLQGEGIYVWSGSEWVKLGESRLGGVRFSSNNFNFLSGVDLRGKVKKEQLTVTWDKARPSYALENGAEPIKFKTTPEGPTTTSTSPFTMELEYEPMPKKVVKALDNGEIEESNPWHLTRQSRLKFGDAECGDTSGNAYVDMSQTNYALWVKGRSSSFSNVIYNASTTIQIPIKGNVDWKTRILENTLLPQATLESILPKKGGRTIDVITPAEKTQIDTEEVKFALSGFNPKQYALISILFQDNQTPKRFEDITMSMVGCFDRETADDGTMLQWVDALFSQADKDEVLAGRESSTLSNSLQLHKDQDGNFFMSGDFGTAGRWMVTNLAAKSFATANRTGDDKVVMAPLTQNSAENQTTPYYIYAAPTKTGQGNPTFYNKNQRMGLLYNWYAATNGKPVRDQINGRNNSSGQLIYQDAEDANNPNIDPLQGRIQGICPNGWHLPSDREWTWLEQEILDNASLYTNAPDQKGRIVPVGVYTDSGTKDFRAYHGDYVLDMCPAPRHDPKYKFSGAGISNPLSYMAPGKKVGLNLLIAGYNRNPYNEDVVYSRTGFWWTASAMNNTEDYAVCRSLFVGGADQGDFGRKVYSRKWEMSIRCKQD